MRADFQRTVEAKEKKWGEMSAEIERLKKDFYLFTATHTSRLRKRTFFLTGPRIKIFKTSESYKKI